MSNFVRPEIETAIPQTFIYGPIFPRFLMERKDICLNAKYLYAVLCDHARDKDFCFPSISTLCRECGGASPNSVRKWLRELVAKGLIYIQYFMNAVSRYFILKNDELPQKRKSNALKGNSGLRSEKVVGAQSLRTPPQDLQPNRTAFNEQKSNTPLPPMKKTENSASDTQKGNIGGGDSFESDFEKVWNAYPRKDGYSMAKKIFLALARKGFLPSVMQLLTAIDRFKETKQWQKCNGQYVPFMRRFLSENMWQDLSKAESSKAENKETAPKLNTEQHTAYIEKQRQEQIKKNRAENDILFLPFVEQFADGKANMEEAYTKWLMVRVLKRRTLTADSVPQNNTLGIMSFINSILKVNKV